jgi:hypothetical protein
MKTLQCLVVAVLLSVLVGANVSAIEETRERKPAPGAALASAALNVVFVPMRLAVTVLFAGIGGLTGLLNGGDEQAANDIWGMVGGRNFLTPAFIQGEEPLRLDSYDTVPRIPPPSRRESYGFPFEPAVPGGREAP